VQNLKSTKFKEQKMK